MKTEDLIGGLVADQGQPVASVRRTFGYALPLALLLAVGVFGYILDMREDFADALTTWRYLLKILATASIAVVGVALLFRIARPQCASSSNMKWVLLALMPLAFGLAAEMTALPMAQWSASAMGRGAIYCLSLVPLIAVGPLAATLVTLKGGAPQSPTMAGAIAGFAAGGVGAFIYTLHCSNDSPFYVAIWYLSAIGIVTLIGAGIGRTWLRW